MEINTLLRQLAEEHIEYSSDQPDEFHYAGDLRVASALVFSSPDPSEYSACGDVPPGLHPVHLGVVRRRDEESGEETAYVSMAFIPLAEPEVIAGAEFVDAIEDTQPLGPDFGFVWDAGAMNAFHSDDTRSDGFADVDALVAHVEAELATADPAGRPRAWVDVVVDQETGLNVLAFPVNDEFALCLEARDTDGKLLGLLCIGTM
ncbi:hypothetical protein LN042_09040 [Kitasatospora sp. RB6PN24]|uniref:hypothetical protein n=1 Tax=Kitasatospora humi TaxID=2893891 RepID=UPI001E604F97|nr:hypothetical protein [Kitasatospora humi]MCC9307245.1 hypothetical protein [Kitasatospora humi]